MAGKGELQKDLYLGSEMDDEDIITVSEQMQDASLFQDRYVEPEIFKKPECLIYTDDKGLLAINVNVLNQLSKVESKLSVVGICGLYRSGKSYLMNWLAEEKTAFALGNTTQSKTKGIWVFCKYNPERKDEVLLFVDTEGLCDLEKGDPEHDSKIFCLTVLISSILIINVNGVLDYGALEKLAFITTLSKNIEVFKDDDEETNAKNVVVASPRLIVCIRDFFLTPEKDGKPLTPDGYLKSCLQETTTKGAMHEKYNGIKTAIKHYFPKRTCFTISHPATGADLQNLESLDEKSLLPQFVRDANALKEYILKKKPKAICNASKKKIDGADLTTMITAYVDALRKETSVTCEDAYTLACRQRNKKVVKMALNDFRMELNKWKCLTSKAELTDKFLVLYERTLSKYREGSFAYRIEYYEDFATDQMKKYRDKIIEKIRRGCMETGGKKLSRLYCDMLKTNEKRYMSEGYRAFEADMKKLEEQFKKEMKKYDDDDVLKCLCDFKEATSDDKMIIYSCATKSLDESGYRKRLEDIESKMKNKIGRTTERELLNRNQFLEDELRKLKESYVEIYEKLEKKSSCTIL